jgi:hypothetical protein
VLSSTEGQSSVAIPSTEGQSSVLLPGEKGQNPNTNKLRKQGKPMQKVACHQHRRGSATLTSKEGKVGQSERHSTA